MRTPLLLLLAVFIAQINPALAQEYDSQPTAESATDEPVSRYSDSTDHAWLSFGAGYYDMLDGDDSAGDFRVEYRHGDKFLWELKPWGGAELTTDGTFWMGGGVLADFKMAPSIYITPSIGAGIYAQGSSHKDLGSAIEFRTGVEGGYEFMNGHRLGVALSHMSNAGIDDQNPGAETLNLYYHMPIGNLF